MAAVYTVQIGKLPRTTRSLFSPKFNVIGSSIHHVSAGYHTTVFSLHTVLPASKLNVQHITKTERREGSMFLMSKLSFTAYFSIHSPDFIYL